VAYEEGDPDYPLVVGAVYNGKNKHPYAPPDKDGKTQSGFKSNSSTGGNGYNEFMFEDKKDSEFIRMHAQKDHKVTVRHIETRKIGEAGVSGASRETTLVTGDDKLTIATGSQSTTAAMSVTITAGTSLKLICGGSTINMTPASISIMTGTLSILAATTIAPTLSSPTVQVGLINGHPI
jgi:type VI secretion system secreted protein VgrG